MATAQPEWRAPPTPSEATQARLPKLKLYNSLTKDKRPFYPRHPEGKEVTWYACGPTVYDDAHLGHARNYVSTDIIRRILQDYFGFDVKFVMNITDVDDKIIVAARQQYLLRQCLAEHSEVDDELRAFTLDAFHAHLKKHLTLISQDIRPETYAQAERAAYGHVLAGKSLTNDATPPGDKEAKVKMNLTTASSAAKALQLDTITLEEFRLMASGVLLPHIDSKKADTINGSEHGIFTTLTKRYEERFFEDMGHLNVRYPDKVVRVTEYDQEIVDFVKQVQDNGFAYENEGSIYYDTTAWEKSGGVYARLEPWNRNDKQLQEDGEGALSVKKSTFKRSGADFALWKASKTGEPSWQSPWGEGRPGWHIECSAMASHILGSQIDIHSGGIDLAFPHHDNELAQSEAYYARPGEERKQWVNYFLHMGHLSIQGSKMSKSLKNFTTIREALEKGEYTPRSMRVVFLLGAWRDGLEITDDFKKAAATWMEKLDNFFVKVRDLQQNPTAAAANGASAPGASGSGLEQELEAAQQRLRDALEDSFDTPTAMRVLVDLVLAYNSASSVAEAVSLAIGAWITEIVVIFGLDASHQAGQMGWSGLDIPEEAKAAVHALSDLRDSVRQQTMGGSVTAQPASRKSEIAAGGQPYAKALADFEAQIADLRARRASSAEFLAACDHVRNVVLWDLGISLEDRENNKPALVRPLSASHRAERFKRNADAATKAAATEKARAEAEAAEKARLEKGKVSHLDMFRTSEYSEWDGEGLPVKDAEGKEVTKSRGKKLRKEWDRQKTMHEKFLASREK